jgi:peroxiredoxin Q/BCP
MSTLVVGVDAPDFSLLNSQGKIVKLSDFRGSIVVLYFYPKDDTPGCTVEACDFRDNLIQLRQNIQPVKGSSLVVLGVSPDSSESHKHFKDKYDLPFDLLSDPDKKIATAYGAYGEKNNYGKIVMGIIRSTFIIGIDGRIERVYYNVKAKGHVDRVLSDMVNS